MEIQVQIRSWSIGRLSALSGSSVRTIRWYSDLGLLEADRTSTGHRRYGRADLARLRLISALRSIDVDIATISGLLEGVADLSSIVAAHVHVLEMRLQTLRRQIAVARAAAEETEDRTVCRLETLVRIEAAERQRLFSKFWEEVMHRSDSAIRERFSGCGTPALPADPTGEQLDAWLELADLAVDPDFIAASTRQATWFSEHALPGGAGFSTDMDDAIECAAMALDAGVPTSHPRAKKAITAVVRAYADAFGRREDPRFRQWLAAELDQLDNQKAARWWHLIGVLNGTDIAANTRTAEAIAWCHQQLRDEAPLSGDPMNPHRRPPAPRGHEPPPTV